MTSATNACDCPAASAGRLLADLERQLDARHKALIERQSAGRPSDAILMQRLEQEFCETVSAVDAAAWRLAECEPASLEGALAQMLAAIRDRRTADDDTLLRARRLETHAIAFIARKRLVDADMARRLGAATEAAPNSAASAYSPAA